MGAIFMEKYGPEKVHFYEVVLLWKMKLCAKPVFVSVYMHVFFIFCRVTQSKLMCDTKWAACESTFVYCMQSILHVLHDSKKHTSNTLCAAHKSVFLCAAHKLTGILCQKRIKPCNEMAH